MLAKLYLMEGDIHMAIDVYKRAIEWVTVMTIVPLFRKITIFIFCQRSRI